MFKRYKVETGFGLAVAAILALTLCFGLAVMRQLRQLEQVMPSTLSNENLTLKLRTASHFEPSFSGAYFASEWENEWQGSSLSLEWQDKKVIVRLKGLSSRRGTQLYSVIRRTFPELWVEKLSLKPTFSLMVSRRGAP